MQPQSSNPPEGTMTPTSLKELAELLIKHHDLHEGIYEVGFQINIAIGSFALPPNDASPGAMFTVGGVGLSKVAQITPHCADASVVNPRVQKARKAIKRG